MFETMPESAGSIIGVKAKGKLVDRDYKELVPKLEKMIAEMGAINVLMDFEDFDGYSVKATIDDFEFTEKHRSDIKKLALVGNKNWEADMAKCAKWFMDAETKYFDVTEQEEAWKWLQE
ncbi:STAS/SEC14 domain-containing protein [Patescibacteria group bacterium]|nr:STAS/SEC14 domain-containing protein [Patescibacteria group bacterium]